MQRSTRQDTKAALVRAAQRLFAEKGLGTVSVKDITKAAGARNPSAVHYHFGNVEALIEEVFAQRYRDIENTRLERLAKVDVADPAERLHALMEAALSPFLETCLEEDGRLYVGFCVQFASDPRFNSNKLVGDIGMQSVAVLQEKLMGCLSDLPRDILIGRLRLGFNISLLQAAEYSRKLEEGNAPPVEDVIRECALTLSGYFSAKAP